MGTREGYNPLNGYNQETMNIWLLLYFLLVVSQSKFCSDQAVASLLVQFFIRLAEKRKTRNFPKEKPLQWQAFTASFRRVGWT